MDPRIVAILEARDIHAAVCRARRAHLACSTCSELAERAARVRVRLVEAA